MRGKIKSPIFWRERLCILGWKSLAEVLSCCFFYLVWKYVVGILCYSIWEIHLNFQEPYSSAKNKKLCVCGDISGRKSQMLYWILDKNTQQEWGWCWRMDFVCRSPVKRMLVEMPECGSLPTWLWWYLNRYWIFFSYFPLVWALWKLCTSSASPAHWLLQKCPRSLLQNSMLPLEILCSHDKNPMSGFAMQSCLTNVMLANSLNTVGEVGTES